MKNDANPGRNPAPKNGAIELPSRETIQLAEGVSQLHYFDPDIVVGCKWALIHQWATGGIALSGEFNCSLSARYPLRQSWKAWIAQSSDLKAQSECNRYYSAGYIGIPSSHNHMIHVHQTETKPLL